MTQTLTQTVDAIEVLDDLFGDAPGYQEAVAEEAEKLNIASVIYEARIAAGLSQRQLADLIHSRQSVISRLEDADYGSQSLTMLRRIARALGKRLEVKFAPLEAAQEAAAQEAAAQEAAAQEAAAQEAAAQEAAAQEAEKPRTSQPLRAQVKWAAGAGLDRGGSTGSYAETH